MAEVTKSLSNLIKSGFVAFSVEDAMVIDANQSNIIKSIDAANEELQEANRVAIAEALISDADLESQVLQSEEIKQAKTEADAILEQAKKEARAVERTALEEAETIRQEARDEGYRHGRDQGYQDGNKDALEEYREKQVELEKEFANEREKLAQEKEALYVETEKKMTEILMRLVPKITGVYAESEESVILFLVNQAIRDLDSSERFVIKVSEADYDGLVSHKEEIYGIANPNIEIEIFSDAKLTDKQCIIETDHGIVNCSLDIQLDNFIKAIKLLAKI